MNAEQINRGLLDFIDASPNAFFAAANTAAELKKAGFTRLYENESWNIVPGGDYYVTRNDSALIAFRLPRGRLNGFNIAACHGDSPCFKIKRDPEIACEGGLVKLNIEKYGGMIPSTWFDRPLSVAGRIMIRTPEGAAPRLVSVDRDLVMIPTLAIHMSRDAGDQGKPSVQNDMLPLFSCDPDDAEGGFLRCIASEADVDPGDIIDFDLFLYNRDAGRIYGANGEFIASGRLDDLQCAYASLAAFLESEPRGSAAVHCLFDNEEVGSGTKQGAASTFLADVLKRINFSLGGNDEDYARYVADSFMVSADNAHSVHPNYPGKADPTNRPYLNGGVVIKYSANQKYTTDAVSGAVFRLICERAAVPVQTFVNHSDIPGGSTLGNISTSQVSLNAVDIGLPQLSMHSAYETAGTKDTYYLVRALRELFSSDVRISRDGGFTVE